MPRSRSHPDSHNIIDQVAVVIDGANLATEKPHLMDALIEVEVDSSLYLPDMAVLTFRDEDLRWMNDELFKPGATLEISLSREESAPERVFVGEVTAIEPRFERNTTAKLILRAYDKIHRLTRSTKSRVYVQVTDSDMVQQIAREAGLRAQVEATSEVYDHVFQHNQTDLEFLQERADRIGYELSSDNQTLFFRQSRHVIEQSMPVELDWGKNLQSFSPRLTLMGQVSKVTVKGWDAQNKREIVGEATSTDTAPDIRVGGQGTQVVRQTFDAAHHLIVRRPVHSQGEADTVAQAILDEINAGFVEAEGVAVGNPKLVAGQSVTISSLGQRFSGTYMLTASTHLYTTSMGYETRFRVEGARPRLMADLLGGERQQSVWNGVVPAIVTNNRDEQNMGRVKVKFPWLDTSLESDWARVAAVGAGKDMGVWWLPEVNDEVLVAFEHGDFNHPYIVGSLWNGKDTPPESTNNTIKGGKVQTRMLRTRAGHTIRLSDDDGEQVIEIFDAADATHIKLDAKARTLEIISKGDVTLKTSTNLKIEATSSIEMKANASIKIEAQGELTLKGAMVKIN
ncbi:MAG: VgrG-related protein [Chloroflexota bacterium]|nr:VgrG-related protein [Chloroflexota bacterium]